MQSVDNNAPQGLKPNIIGGPCDGASKAAPFQSTPIARFTFLIKTAQAFALAVAVCFSVGATDAGSRYNNLNHRLMCTCGCAEILGECNHVGCQNSASELSELRAGISAGQSDEEILASFTAKYGAVVLAAPTKKGFDLVAWIAPFAVFAAALLGTILLVRRWSIGKTQTVVAIADPVTDAIKEKIRRETE
jgi:cytochrome c-type biogenesis protein CcmH